VTLSYKSKVNTSERPRGPQVRMPAGYSRRHGILIQ